MGRPTEQSMKCLQRDLDWARRIRKRARDNETRSKETYDRVLASLKYVIDTFDEELDEDARVRERAKRRASAKSEKAEKKGQAA